jgi:tetratricopeptide (TPR) repeat protein
MKNLVIGIFLVLSLIASAQAFSYEEMEADGISLKAGPTDVTEELSLAWVEAALYPKMVKKGQEIFVEVRLASPVRAVRLDMDTEIGILPLCSEDNKNWSRVLKVSPGALAGLHVARITIVGKNEKMIYRSLDYVVAEDVLAEKIIPLTVLNNALLVDNGRIVSQLLPGVQVTALYKAPFYRVKLEDGREGWIEASRVKEPVDELYLLGFRAYQNKNYSDAENHFKQVLRFDPKHSQTHFYLAKIYMKQNKMDLAAGELKETLALDPQNSKALEMADVIARKNLELKNYAKVFDLKPQLLIDKLNEKVKEKVVIEAKAQKTVREIKVSQAVLADSINLVKNAKTNKGNLVSSAVNSVLSMTRSLGTRIHEDGWRVAAASDGVMVIYACRQERSGKLEDENFEWRINQDQRSVVPLNENARLLMNRW